MATFYVLPARVQVGQSFQRLLEATFPGLAWPRESLADLAEALAQAAEEQPGAYVVFAEDLDDDLSLEESLERDFGAEPGDEAIVVASRPGHPVERRRVVPRAA